MGEQLSLTARYEAMTPIERLDEFNSFASLIPLNGDIPLPKINDGEEWNPLKDLAVLSADFRGNFDRRSSSEILVRLTPALKLLVGHSAATLVFQEHIVQAFELQFELGVQSTSSDLLMTLFDHGQTDEKNIFDVNAPMNAREIERLVYHDELEGYRELRSTMEASDNESSGSLDAISNFLKKWNAEAQFEIEP